jgi:tetratricopeptide (TPR) repeat protein
MTKSRTTRLFSSALVALLTAGSLSLPARSQEVLFQTYFNDGFKALTSGDASTAEKMFVSAEEVARNFPDGDPRYFKTLDGLALSYAQEHKFDDADKTYAKCIAIKEKATGADSGEVCITMGNYADMLFTRGKYKQAEALYQQALKGLMVVPALYIEKEQNLGTCLSEEGEYDQAEVALNDALKKQIELTGDNSASANTIRLNLINTMLYKGDYKGGEREANALLQRFATSGDSDPIIPDACRAALETVALRFGDYDKANQIAAEIVENTKQRKDAKPEELPRALQRQAMVFEKQNRYADAEALLLKAKEMFEARMPEHPYTGSCMVDLGKVYVEQGKYADAEPVLQQALSIEESKGDPTRVADCLTYIADLDAGEQKLDEAEHTYLRALEIERKAVGAEHLDNAELLGHLGTLYIAMHKNDKAETSFVDALNIREKVLPPGAPDIAKSIAQLAAFYKNSNEPAKAQPLYRRLLERDKKYAPDNQAARVSDLLNLSAVAQALGNGSEADKLHQEAVRLRGDVPGGKTDVDNAGVAALSAGAVSPITDKWCLCIGISSFKDPSINLKYSAKDATDFRNFLVAQGNFKSDHVKLLTDSAATRENIIGQLGDQWLGKVVKPTDLVVIYVSSHGSQSMQQASGANFLVAYDTNKDALVATGIPMQWLSEMVKEQVKSKRTLLVLDVCHSGSASNDASGGGNGGLSDVAVVGGAGTGSGGKGLVRVPGVDVSKLTAGAGQVILCSSAADQASWESKEYPNGVFTRRLIESLSSRGSGTKLSDAYTEMKGAVENEVLRDRAVVQTPIIKANWSGGELIPLAPIP